MNSKLWLGLWVLGWIIFGHILGLEIIDLLRAASIVIETIVFLLLHIHNNIILIILHLKLFKLISLPTTVRIILCCFLCVKVSWACRIVILGVILRDYIFTFLDDAFLCSVVGGFICLFSNLAEVVS